MILLRLFALSLVVASFAGCGGNSTTSDEEVVRDVSSAFLEALIEGDGDTACSLMSADQKRILTAPSTESCATVMATVSGLISSDDAERRRNELKEADVTVIADGTIARVTAASQPLFVLVKDNGEWYINGTR